MLISVNKAKTGMDRMESMLVSKRNLLVGLTDSVNKISKNISIIEHAKKGLTVQLRDFENMRTDSAEELKHLVRILSTLKSQKTSRAKDSVRQDFNSNFK